MESTVRHSMGPSVDASSHGIRIEVERHAWAKMHGWCKAANSEVSGLGIATLKDGVFTVTDVYLPKQKCSGSYTELDDAATGKLLNHLYKKGKDISQVKFWWHTHYNFGVFWSGTDDDNAQRLAKANGDWELSIVINQKGDYRCRIDFVQPVDLTLDNLKVTLINNSRKMKRKRNYKSDIKRWVRPMYEPVKYTHARTDFDFGYNVSPHLPGFHWENRTQVPLIRVTDEIEKDKQIGFKGKKWWEAFRAGKNRKEYGRNHKGSESEIHKISKDITSAGYVNHGGILMPAGAEKCKCDHVGDWGDCVCNTYCDICVNRLVIGG